MSDPKTSPDGTPTDADAPEKDVIEDAVILDEPEEASAQNDANEMDSPSEETSEDAAVEAAEEPTETEDLSDTVAADPEPVADDPRARGQPSPQATWLPAGVPWRCCGGCDRCGRGLGFVSQWYRRTG